MNVFKEQVCHRQYGLGTVVDQNENMIEVQFDDNHGKKKFLYPSAFESFLSLNSTVLQGEMDEELKKIRDEKAAERQKSADDIKKRLETEKKTLLEQKRASTKKRASAKSAEDKISINKRNDSDFLEDEEREEEY